MKPVPQVLAAVLSLLTVGSAGAQDVASNAPLPESTWTIGAGVIVSNSEFAGEGARTIVLPLLGYESERFFLQGLDAGVHLLKRDDWQIDVQLSGRLTGWDAKDLGRAELARNGIDRDLLDDRDFAVDAGVAVEWTTRAGKWALKTTSDVTSTSDGSSLQAGYSAPLTIGRGVLEPGIKATYWNASLANYYYGTSSKEIARGVPAYRPGSLLMPELSLVYVRPLSQQWLWIAAVEGRFLPDEVRESPLVEQDRNSVVSASVFFLRSF